MIICAKLNICTLIAPPSPSPKPLTDIASEIPRKEENQKKFG
jgi:hypothetical protein